MESGQFCWIPYEQVSVRAVCAVNPVRNSIAINNMILKGQISNAVKYQQLLKG
jgi:hypothetical protein